MHRIFETIKQLDIWIGINNGKPDSNQQINSSKTQELISKITNFVKKKRIVRVTESDCKEINDISSNRCIYKDENSPTLNFLIVKVVHILDRSLIDVPILVICVDEKGQYFAISIYGTDYVQLSKKLVPFSTILKLYSSEFGKITF